MVNGTSVFEIVPGKDHQGIHVVSVIVKRSYRVGAAGEVTRCKSDEPLRMIDQYYDGGDPESATVQYESELAPFKPLTDVVVIGKAYAPNASPTKQMEVSVRVGTKVKSLIVRGDRHCRFRPGMDPVFSDPNPFLEMEIRYERAYGGRDEKSIPEIPFHYPRNSLGKGVVLKNTEATVNHLALPNVEDAQDQLTPERLVLGEPRRWVQQPMPQGFGWRQRTWYPRCIWLGSYPAFVDPGVVTPEERLGILPKNHIALARQFKLPTNEAVFNNGASLGMSFPDLQGDERIVLRGLTPDGQMSFSLPGDFPEIVLDIGRGPLQLSPRLHTVSIRPDERAVDLIWRGSQEYEGYDWWPQSTRLHAEVA